LFFAVDQRVYVIRGEFNVVSVGDGVRRASVNAVAAEDAAGVVDVVNAGIAFARRDSIGFGVFSSFYVNTVCGACCGTEKTTDAFLKTVFVALEHMNAAIARRDAGRDLGIAFSRRFAKHRAEGDAEALVERRECFADFAEYRWHGRSTLTKVRYGEQIRPYNTKRIVRKLDILRGGAGDKLVCGRSMVLN
jgi:hypothetical protein